MHCDATCYRFSFEVAKHRCRTTHCGKRMDQRFLAFSSTIPGTLADFPCPICESFSDLNRFLRAPVAGLPHVRSAAGALHTVKVIV